METQHYPQIIQGGMGVNTSCYALAKAVSSLGQLGTLSGTILEGVLVHELQNGDIGGHIRRALSKFPFPHISARVLKKFYVEGGVHKDTPTKRVQMFNTDPPDLLISTVICANYVYVWLAKEGHNNPVSINYLEKVAMPHIYAITGAMLADVDFITMGAGIPLQIPEVINSIFESKIAQYRIPVIGTNTTSFTMTFDIQKFFSEKLNIKKIPKFIPIISSNLLATMLIQKLPSGSIYGFVVEEPTAGGHNAPPRNKLDYGEKDYVDYKKLSELGLPFWIGGGYASPGALNRAMQMGASGIQAGSIFALSEESGMNPSIRREVRRLGFRDELKVRTDMRISPTGFPFKVIELAGTISESSVYESRSRICNIGGLVSLYEKEDGKIGRRCAAEPVDKFLRKGGKIEETIGRGCLCNGLFSTASKNSDFEPMVVTIGDDVSFLKRLMADEDSTYTVREAISYLLGAL
jgi:nitronate monooxygenase